jgi:outer membrane protein OmpA-like peptidoglycan-associated protein
MTLMKQILIPFLVLLFGSATQLLAQNDTLSFSKPEKLGSQVNSSAEESIPILSPDGKTLYFARTFHSENTGGKNAGQDIWMSQKNNDEYTKANKTSELNDQLSNVVVGVSNDGNRLYLLNQKISNEKSIPGLSVSTFDSESQKWGIPVAIQVPNLIVESTFYSAYVSPYEDFILWSLPVDSLGNNLYVSTSTDAGKTWTAPMDLGIVNTLYDEISPSFNSKLDLLFYASNDNGDAFNYDIYYSKRLDNSWTYWSAPMKIESVNSDDFDAYFFATDEGLAYFSSNRGDSLSNIYQCELMITPTETDSIDLVLEEEEPVLIIETSEGTDKNRKLESLSKEELTAESTRIRFVYFDFDKYNISRKYIEVLDDAADILDKYPEFTLIIEGYTDAVGTEAYNNQLSINRANSAKEFMLINGIDPSRVKVVGYGESKPYATNYTAEGRALNRRVELVFKEN